MQRHNTYIFVQKTIKLIVVFKLQRHINQLKLTWRGSTCKHEPREKSSYLTIPTEKAEVELARKARGGGVKNEFSLAALSWHPVNVLLCRAQ